MNVLEEILSELEPLPNIRRRPRVPVAVAFEVQREANRSSQSYVRWVQESLNKLLHAGLAVDGISGAATRKAVRTLQRNHGLSIDGVVGPQTEALIVQLTSSQPPAATPGSGASHESARPLAAVSTAMPASPNGAYRIHSSRLAFGVPKVIEALQWIGEEWHRRTPEIVLGIRDISRRGGGEIRPHRSHRVGLDADLSLTVRATGRLIGNPKRENSDVKRVLDYDAVRPYAKRFVELVETNPVLPVKRIWFFDHTLSKLIPNSSTSAMHYRHFHVRFCLPSGAQIPMEQVGTDAKYYRYCRRQS